MKTSFLTRKAITQARRDDRTKRHQIRREKRENFDFAQEEDAILTVKRCKVLEITLRVIFFPLFCAFEKIGR